MAGGLTPTGFNTPNLQEIIAELEKDLQDAFGNPLLSLEDNENMGNLGKVVANRESLVWQAIKQVYNTWTFNGAEAEYLDELFAFSGIFREGATAGSGFAVVETNSSAIDSTPIVVGTLFSGTNGIQYAVTTEVPVSQRVTAFKLDSTLVSLGLYNLRVKNRVTDVEYEEDISLASGSTAGRQAFIQNVKTFLQGVNVTETNIYESVDGLTLYWGFDEAFELEGLEQTVDFLCTPSLGNRHTLVECVATSTGFNPLRVGQITSMSVLPTGYVSVTNLSPFSSGTEIETDASFIERASTITDSPRSSTRPAIISGLLRNVAGIEKVKIIKTINAGVVTLEPIIIGGEIADIASELYRTQPINNIYSGNIAYTYGPTEDGETEIIRFTRGVSQSLSVRVTYKTDTDTTLTDNEKSTATTNLVNFSSNWQLGDTIFNSQLMSAVFAATNYGRLISLLVEVKQKEDPDTSYTNANYQALDNELPILLSEDVSFVQVL